MNFYLMVYYTAPEKYRIRKQDKGVDQKKRVDSLTSWSIVITNYRKQNVAPDSTGRRT